MHKPTDALLPLIEYLESRPQRAATWGEWVIAPVTGGANNLLYRATGPAGDFAVKFTQRDARDRAGREFATLRALDAAGLDLAPRAVLHLPDRPLPVVVQTWLAGDVRAAPPADAAEWRLLLGHLAAIHRFTPANSPQPLRPAVLSMLNAADGLARIAAQVAQIPTAQRPAALTDLVGRVRARAWPTWPAPALTLCRCDPNPRNLIRRAPAWASVDWENSGWGDPAFELGDLLAHPEYAAVPPAHHAVVLNTYAALTGDAGAPARARVHYTLMVVWWVARFARYLTDIPRGADPRLVPLRPDWREYGAAQYTRYLARIEDLLA